MRLTRLQLQNVLDLAGAPDATVDTAFWGFHATEASLAIEFETYNQAFRMAAALTKGLQPEQADYLVRNVQVVLGDYLVILHWPGVTVEGGRW